MTLYKAIASANALRPNAIDDSVKAAWIYELEGEVAELMGLPYPPNPFPSDGELLMPYPKDNIYHLYVCAMIDNAIEDTTLYINDMTIANEARDHAFRWWRRHHMKGCPQYIRAYPWQRRVPPSTHGTVTSVNGMTGDVELEANDIPFDNKFSEIASDDLQGATQEAIALGKLNAEITTEDNYRARKEYYDSLDCFVITEEEE